MSCRGSEASAQRRLVEILNRAHLVHGPIPPRSY
jgi:hypothetical protein